MKMGGIRRIGSIRTRHVVRWTSRFVETGTLVLWLVIAGSIGTFILIAEKVAEGETLAVDRMLLLALRNPADPAMPFGPGWFQELMRDITGLGGLGIITLVTAAVAGFLWIQGKRRSLVLTVAAVASGVAVSSLLKLGFERPRPDLVPHGSIVYTASFPSGHALSSAVTYLTLAALVARVQPDRGVKIYIITLASILTIMIGTSRVYLGVHWPSDVAAGWSVGAAWAMLWWVIARWLEARGVVEPEQAEPKRVEEDVP